MCGSCVVLLLVCLLFLWFMLVCCLSVGLVLRVLLSGSERV